MFFDGKADSARNNVKKFDQKIYKKELKCIIQSIEKASKKGYTSFRWRGGINKGNLYILEKEYGYKIIHINTYVDEIHW